MDKKQITLSQLETLANDIRAVCARVGIPTVNWSHPTNTLALLHDPLGPRTALAEALIGSVQWRGYVVVRDPMPVEEDHRQKFSGKIVSTEQLLLALEEILPLYAAIGLTTTYKECVNGIRVALEEFLREQGYEIENRFEGMTARANYFFIALRDKGCTQPESLRPDTFPFGRTNS
jgi:hypothetical protein